MGKNWNYLELLFSYTKPLDFFFLYCSTLFACFSIGFQGAAVAYVADLLKVPAIFIKAVTDIIDGDKPTSEEFLQNLAAVTAALDQAVTQVVDHISGKCLPEL